MAVFIHAPYYDNAVSLVMKSLFSQNFSGKEAYYIPGENETGGDRYAEVRMLNGSKIKAWSDVSDKDSLLICAHGDAFWSGHIKWKNAKVNGQQEGLQWMKYDGLGDYLVGKLPSQPIALNLHIVGCITAKAWFGQSFAQRLAGHLSTLEGTPIRGSVIGYRGLVEVEKNKKVVGVGRKRTSALWQYVFAKDVYSNGENLELNAKSYPIEVGE